MNYYQDIAATMAAKRALFYSSSSSSSSTTRGSSDDSSSSIQTLVVDTAIATPTNIFREMDCEIETDTTSPRVTRATPISETSSQSQELEQEENQFRMISPYPFPAEEETEERLTMGMMELQDEARLIAIDDELLPAELSRDWAEEAMDDDESVDIYRHPIENFSNGAAIDKRSSSIYSFYFEAIPMEDEQLSQQNNDYDDFTISSHGSDCFVADGVAPADIDGCLDNISSDPVAFWENSIIVGGNTSLERSLSPTQISLGSNSDGGDGENH